MKSLEDFRKGAFFFLSRLFEFGVVCAASIPIFKIIQIGVIKGIINFKSIHFLLLLYIIT